MRLTLLAAALVVALAAVLLGPPTCAQDELPPQLVARTDPQPPDAERKALRVPPGFEVQLVAAEPAIRKPMNLAFDDRGRLWVTDTVEYPFPAKDGQGRDSVKILEDTDGDGRADKVTTFADGLNIPIGVLPVTGGAIVYSIPNIYLLRDTDGDDKADRREVLFGPVGYQDTHGMINALTWGYDGWVYACHGFANTSTLRAADGSMVTLHSGNTFRFQPDGSRIEQYTWGQVNPFGLAFDPLGNLFSADCHTRPLMMLLRGGYYPSFGKPHDGLGFAPEICGHDHGSTAIAGIVCYAADHFPPAYRDTVFIGNVVTNRINHDRLERHGSTLRAVAQPDFLVSQDPWFRPVDLKLGPDGALYVADFYNRIIGHYEVPLTHPGRDRERGRIWRIVYRGPDAGKLAAPRADWTKAQIEELLADLAHPNLTVRMTAANQLVARGRAAAAAVRGVMHPKASPFQRMHGLGVLERLGALDEPTLTAAARDDHPGVRVHAMRVLSERKDLTPAQRRLVYDGLKDADAFVRRAAADALGRHPSADHVRPLLDLRHAVPKEDVQLLHTVRMALRNQLRPAAVWREVPAPTWSAADRRAVADAAAGVPSAEAAGFLLHHILRVPEDRETLARYVHHIARYGDDQTVQALLPFALKDRPDDLRHQTALFRAVHRGTQERGAALPDAAQRWANDLVAQLLAAPENDLVQAGIELAGALKLADTQDALRALAGTRERAEEQRHAALNALVQINPREQVALLGRLLNDAAEPISFRERVAQTLAGLNQPEARVELLKGLPTAPARLQSAIALALASSLPGAELLLEAVATGKASARLLQERPVRLRLAATKVPQLDERLAKLTRGLPPADQRLDELLNRRRAGFAAARPDPAQGAKVFEKNCANCHQLDGKGAKVGPQLDGIGARGPERLLEDLIDPNRNVDQAFRTTVILLDDGRLVTGLVLREEGAVLVLADAQGQEVRIPKTAIAKQELVPLSPMPANLAAEIAEADFYHLLAYLLAQRAK